MRIQNTKYRNMDYKKYQKKRFVQHALSTPVIWSMLIPIVILDIWIEIYHRICFPLYGLPYVKRRNYVKVDRHKLQYLNPLEKIGCAYCGYANGVFAYSVEIAARTEKYWCGIMHKQRAGFINPSHHSSFTKYGDEDAFTKKYMKK